MGADFGPVPSGIFADPRLRRAGVEVIGWTCTVLGLAAVLGRFPGDPDELAHRIRCHDVEEVERLMLELARRRLIRLWVSGDGCCVAQFIRYHQLEGMPTGRSAPSLIVQQVDPWADPAPDDQPEALAAFYGCSAEDLAVLWGDPRDTVTMADVRARWQRRPDTEQGAEQAGKARAKRGQSAGKARAKRGQSAGKALREREEEREEEPEGERERETAADAAEVGAGGAGKLSLPMVAEWPTPEHRAAAALWLARVVDERGSPPPASWGRRLLELARRDVEAFGGAVERMLGEAKGWRDTDSVAWLGRQVTYARERLDEELRRRNVRRGQRGLAPLESLTPTPTPPPPARDPWADQVDQVMTAWRHALGGQRETWAAEARASLGATADALPGIALPATVWRGLDERVRLVELPPIPTPRWRAVVEALRARLSPYEMRNWVEPIVPLALDGETLVLGVPDPSHSDWVDEAGWLEGLDVRWVQWVHVDGVEEEDNHAAA